MAVSCTRSVRCRMSANITAPAPRKKVVNLLRVGAPQQVMLEVKIAEVSKTLLDRLGARIGISRNKVKYHLKNLYDKLGVSNRAMAVAMYMQTTMDQR